MNCTNCGKQFKKGDKAILTGWSPIYFFGDDSYTFGDAHDGDDKYFCPEHAPGDMKRAYAGITHITGAARLGSEGGK
jgi:hypothetical protein